MAKKPVDPDIYGSRPVKTKAEGQSTLGAAASVVGTHIANKFRTPTGIAINELIKQVQNDHPEMNRVEAREHAKQIINARKTLKYGSGGKFKHQVLTKIFGQTMGEKIAKLSSNPEREAEAKAVLDEYRGKESKADRIPPSEFKMIVKRLDAIEAQIKSLKVVKVDKKPTAAMNTLVKDFVMQNLVGLFGKDKAKDLYSKIPQGLSPEEATRHGLIAGGMSESAARLAKIQVPSEVAAAHAEQQAAKDEKDQLEQEAKDKKDEKWKKDVKEELDDIKDKAGDAGKKPGVVDSAMETFGNNLMGFILKYVGGPLLAAGIGLIVGRFIGMGIDELLKYFSGGKIQSLGDAIYQGVDAVQSLWGGDDASKQAAAEQAAKAVLDKKNRRGTISRNEQTPTVAPSASPTPTQTATPVTSLATNKSDAQLVDQEWKDFVNKGGYMGQRLAAMKLANAAEEKRKLVADDKKPVIIAPQVSTPVVASSQGNNVSPTVIKVRNDEPSQGGYVSQLFNHPVTDSGSRM